MLIIIGYLIRTTVDESPVFRAMQSESAERSAPLPLLFRNHWRKVIQGGVRPDDPRLLVHRDVRRRHLEGERLPHRADHPAFIARFLPPKDLEERDLLNLKHEEA